MAEKDKGNDAPIAAKGAAFKGWLRVFEDPRQEGRQKNVIIALLLIAILFLALALKALTPLKEKVPFFIESDSSTGAVTISNKIAKQFAPDESNIIFFVKIFIRDIITVDSRLTTDVYFPEGYAMTRGNATNELRQYIIDNKVLEKIGSDPNFKRDVRLISMPSFISQGVVLARYQVSDLKKNYAMTIHYAIIPPDTDEERLRNPIGFYITDFVINEEN